MLLLLGLAIAGLFMGLIKGQPIYSGLSAAFLAGSILYGKGFRWARLLSIGAILGLGYLSVVNFTVYPVAGTLCLILGGLGLWNLIGLGVSQDNDEPLTSMVLLLSKPLYGDAELLREIFSKVIGEGLTIREEPPDKDFDEVPDLKEGEGFLVGQSPQYMLGAPSGVYMVHDQEEPYMDDPEEAADETNELRASNALRDHKAWVAVDLVIPKDHEMPVEEHYKFIGRLIAELAEYSASNCLAVFIPESSKFFPFDEEMLEGLRNGKAVDALIESIQVPVVQIKDDDEEMLAAVAEAKKTFPKFKAAFEGKGEDEQTFAIKAPITSAGNTEFIWISVSNLTDDTITGTIDNEPVDLPGIKEGDEVEVSVSELNDWTIMTEDGLEGGFTMKVLMEAHRRAAEGN